MTRPRVASSASWLTHASPIVKSSISAAPHSTRNTAHSHRFEVSCISAVASANRQHRADDHLAAAEARRDPAGDRHDDQAAARLRGGQQADHVGAIAGLRQREGSEGKRGAAAESDDGNAKDQREEIASEDDFHRARCYYGRESFAPVRGLHERGRGPRSLAIEVMSAARRRRRYETCPG